ncbi:MAG: cysteine desulfurase [Alphaproteobacteria bacterium]|nr:cysteine desulfurase [Alphaproteobacteria bacterium]HCQ70787.1 cysteine desulfurase [Rhodospirillaceae bacterium]|tara:strand:- start:6133 stop:7275 length:1143 start_codon:yes stop_codon:yes gene_type:complete
MANNDLTKRIYLDYNATSPLRDLARTAIMDAHAFPLNASSVHAYGRMGRKIIEDTRAHLSRAINCPAAQITFNSGATEGNNTVINHFAQTYPKETILIGATEHPSIHDLPCANIKTIPTDHNGVVNLDALENMLGAEPRTSLVSVMMANNETGTLQPLKDITTLAHSKGALIHCDATQGLGRIHIDMQALGIDLMTVSSHKIGGPQGVGALAVGLCGVSPILLHGGGQEKKQRAGTENVAGIAGFGAAITQACDADILTHEQQRLEGLRTHLEKAITDTCPEAVIHAQTAARIPNSTLISIPGAKAESMLMAFDLDGIAISNGSACSSGTVKASHVLNAMGTEKNLAKGTLRISTGWQTTQGDIDAFIQSFTKILQRIQK